MGISEKPPKPFPITKGLPCQLKWTHSTVYLTKGISGSCHRAGFGNIIKEGESLNFHNIPNKLEERKKMLAGQWPGNGCEHCKHIEKAGGTSDRQIHLNLEGTTAPPELESDSNAVLVTPRQLEVYWGNTCNLKCLYCRSDFSSTIDAEEKRFGRFEQEGVILDDDFSLNPDIEDQTNRLFKWFDDNIHNLHKLMILGGEPFLQKETFRMIEYLEQRQLPDLTLVFFSNLTMAHDRFSKWMTRLQKLVDNKRLDKINVIGSLDCWGPQAEYIRNGLNLELFKKNFDWMVHNTGFTNNINTAFSLLSAQTMPELTHMINTWSKTKQVYWSMMKCNQKEFGMRPYLYPGIFGDRVCDLGFEKAVNDFDPYAAGYKDSVKLQYKTYMQGILAEMQKAENMPVRQKQFKIYLQELDRRRNTKYGDLFPTVAQWLE